MLINSAAYFHTTYLYNVIRISDWDFAMKNLVYFRNTLRLKLNNSVEKTVDFVYNSVRNRNTLFFYKNHFFRLRLSCSYFWARVWPAFSLDPPWILCLKCFLWSLCFPDQFVSSINIFQNTNFKISNLRLVVLIKVVLIKKCIWSDFREHA